MAGVEGKDLYPEGVDGATEYIIVMDLDGKIIDCDDTLISFLETSKEKMIGQSISLLTPSASTKLILKEAQESGWQGDVISVNRLGVRRTLSLKIKVQRDRSGDPVALVGVCRDVTSQKEAAIQLEKSRERFRILFENAQMMIWGTDRNGRIIYFNRKAEELLGYNREELFGEDGCILFPSEESDEICKITDCCKSLPGGENIYELPLSSKSGQRLTGLFSQATVNTPDGPEYFWLVQDITESKRIREDMRSVETELHRATQMASIGELASSIAHEVNNPLAAIGFGIQNLKEILESQQEKKGLNNECSEHFDKISSEIERCQRIVSNLLFFTRVTARRELADVDLMKILYNTVKLFNLDARKKGINFYYNFSTDPQIIHSDEGLLMQIFSNILKNAIDAVGPNGEVECGIKQTADDEISVSFKDNGPGISDENLKKIFEALYTTKPPGEGTGLGLSICKRITVGLGGSLVCHSKVGEGATFTITLPINKRIA